MIETLRSWLNGTREYHTGVALFNILCDDARLSALYAHGNTPASYKSLQEQIKAIFENLKAQKSPAIGVAPTVPPIGNMAKHEQRETTIPRYEAPQMEETATPLYLACKREADDVYKEAMNKRAVLFSMVPANEMEDPNRQDLITARSSLAVDVVNLYNEASRLYERADKVKVLGRLPEDSEPPIDKYAELKDWEVKPAMDALRKNMLKIEKRPQTPERVALLMKHNEDFEKLKVRWELLKQNT